MFYFLIYHKYLLYLFNMYLNYRLYKHINFVSYLHNHLYLFYIPRTFTLAVRPYKRAGPRVRHIRKAGCK